VSPLGAGHIHDTYAVHTSEGRYVLQNVNQSVFANPDALMRQTERFLDHWQQQQRYAVPQLVPGSDGKSWRWIDGQCWRLWTFVEHTRVVDPITAMAQVREAGRAFGALHGHMRSLPGPPFSDPIPGFLQLHHYLQRFDEVAAAAPGDLRRIVDEHRGLADSLRARNTLIHGDCKINNLLFDPAASRVVAIIDFDTVMHGHWAWDFGDLVRSLCFSSGAADTAYFEAALQGFAEQQSACAVADCVAAPGYVTLMLGVRFLTDHLQGDVYFRVSRPGENLQRAQAQFVLFDAFVRLQEDLRRAAERVLDT